MAESQSMTSAGVVAKALIEEHSDFLKESVAMIAAEIMEAEIARRIGAGRGEVSEARATHRNGYRPRPWATRVGEIELAVPRKRSGESYFPSFLEPRKRSEKALLGVVMEAYVNGVSTRKVDHLVSELGIQMSKDQVSRICRELDGQVDAFRTRPLEGATRLLARRLSSHEQAVLAGELTYAVSDKEAEKPATRLRQLASSLSEAEETSQADLIALQESALELAAVQIRASGNIAISGRAGEAPEARATRVDNLAQAISAEISTKAIDSLQKVPQSHDSVAIHLGSCLRLLSARSLIRQFDSKPSEESELETHLHDLRAAWLDLAGLEYAAVTALDQDLETPTYEERFGNLMTAVAEGGKNVLYGGRLVSRPQAFRGSKAWSAQAATLAYAVEAYVRGLREVPSGFAQAQLVILTALSVRSQPSR